MGFLSRLFGPPPKKNEQSVSLNGLGTFSTHVVGESHYQENVRKICGGFTKDGVEHITSARLIHADDNPYDNKAIRIEISGITMGYLSRAEARYFREWMCANGYAGLTATCKAKITGGWDRGKNDIGDFGVTLDLPVEFVEPLSSGAPITNNLEQSLQTDTIIFFVERCQAEELTQCKLGDNINLWVPKDGSKNVHIFRRGSVGGTGWIGYVPRNYLDLVTKHLNSGLSCETEILEIDTKKPQCKIRCRLISKEETLTIQKAEFEVTSTKLQTELQSKYTPRNRSFVTTIELPKNHHLCVGQELLIENKPVDYYIQNAMRLSVNFIDNDGIVVAKKSYDVKIIRTLLKAYFNKYTVKICISKIDNPGEYTLQIIQSIEAQVKVTFI